MTATNPVFHLSGTGATHDVLGMRHVYKVSPVESGAFLLFELEVPPGCGAPMHRHEIDSETFYLLSGELTFITAEGQRTASTGDSTFLPVGGEHAFYNAGPAPARALVIASPGIEAERFFAEIDAARGSEIDLAMVTAVAGKHGLKILAA